MTFALVIKSKQLANARRKFNGPVNPTHSSQCPGTQCERIISPSHCSQFASCSTRFCRCDFNLIRHKIITRARKTFHLRWFDWATYESSDRCASFCKSQWICHNRTICRHQNIVFECTKDNWMEPLQRAPRMEECARATNRKLPSRGKKARSEDAKKKKN